MAQQARLSYTPYGGSPATMDLDVLAVRGAAEPDEVETFDVRHNHLDGSLSEQIAGARRNVEIEFAVVDSAVNRRKMVDFWIATNKVVVCLAGIPQNLVAVIAAGGSLTASTTYYYNVTAVDAVGESAAPAGANATTDVTNKKINHTWDAVTNARLYKIYRRVGAGGTWQLFDYSTTNSYTDDGTVTAIKTATAPSSASQISVVREGSTLTSEWRNGVEITRGYTLRLNENSIFTSFPI